MSERAVVFVVDDDPSMRRSLESLLRSVGLDARVFSSAQEFMQAERPDAPGCLVLDVRMAHMSGPALQERLLAMGARIPIVFISGHGDIPVAIKTIKAGAVDFVQKPYHDQQLLDSINDALQRDAAARATTMSAEGLAARMKALTDREREVMELVVKGLSSKAIGKSLGISYRTVEVHRSRILEKIGVRTVPELIHLTNR